MARIVEFHSSEQPYMSMSEALNYRLAEPLVYRDLDGVLADIPAACCRRCGEVTLRSDTVANHLCTTQERTDRLVERGMEAFHAVVSRNDQLAAAQERIAELEAAANMLANTVALLNSMVRSGEYHSPTSEKVMRESLDAYSAALAGSQGGGDLPQAERQCIACKRRWFVPAQSVSVLGAYWYCELCAGSQGGGGGEGQR